MDDFLKQGGVNIQNEEEELKESAKSDSKKVEALPVYNTDPDQRMSGFLSKSSAAIPGGAGGGEGGDILGMVVSGIGSGLKMGLKTFTETIQIKHTKLYFAIKNGVLYWYAHERSREALKQIDIKLMKAIEISPDNIREFYIINKKKCYRLLSEHEGEA